MMNKRNLTFLTVLFLSLGAWVLPCHAMNQKKTQCLETLNKLQKKHFRELEDLDRQIRQIVSQSQKLDFAKSSNTEMRLQFDNWDSSLKKLVTRRKEISLRRDFVDRLIFQIESKWNSNNLRGFLTKQLLEMAFTDISQNKGQQNQSNSSMWRFLSYLSIALREIPDPNENLLEFIESYLNFSGILNPKAPFSFLEHRHYTSGSLSTRAKSVKLEELGLTLEKRKIELLQQIQPKGELRTELNVSGEGSPEAATKQKPEAETTTSTTTSQSKLPPKLKAPVIPSEDSPSKSTNSPD